ncbi:MAG TPA: TIM barrel protein [Tepidisphaeraceae bacterium]|jgi:sugar phosphate isomerase/epimerase|nr:TIM barrel protein [Tepidisphaeraceae bacterium]
MHQQFVPGLVSITFRKLSATDVVRLAVDAKLQSIEWGGDVHVPHGDVAAAQQVQRACANAGITTSAYGSYYRVGVIANDNPLFEAVLDSALALQAPSIRVWAGKMSSADADEAYRRAVAVDLARIATLAAAQGIGVSLEYHSNTLTDTPETTLQLLQAAAHPNVATYWQPRHGLTIEQNLSDIEMLSPHLRNVHVFHWWPTAATRWPLAEGAERWRAYFAALGRMGGPARHVSLEFVRSDDPHQLREDASTLHELLNAL